MAVTTSNSTDYSKVVFSNSGAAADMVNGALTEDTLSTVLTFDVLTASGGGAKTTLWSVDDGADEPDLAPVAVNKGFEDYNTDLLYKDLTGVLNAETTAAGGKFWIQDGKIKYDASGINPALIDAVAVGSTFTDTFEYTIRMSNGTLSVGTISVNITNNNDGPQVTSANLIGGVTEDAGTVADDPSTDAVEAGPALFVTDTDTITFDDADLLDTHTVSVTPVAGFNEEFGTLTAKITDEATGAGDGTVTWVYSNDNANTQHLGAGDTAVEKFTVTISDGHTGGTVDQVVEVTIHGVNDAATISGTATGDVTEDNPTTATGTLSVADVDDDENTFLALDGGTHDGEYGYGSFSFEVATGKWIYTLDSTNDEVQALNDGGVLFDTYTVHSLDETDDQVITVTIHGADDGPPGGGNVSHTGSQEFTYDFVAPQNGATSFTIELPDGFNFSGTADVTVTGDINKSAEKIMLTLENGTQHNFGGTGGGEDLGDPQSVSQTELDLIFSSTDNTLTVTYHTSDPVDGNVHIVGVLDFTYETLV